MERLHLQKEQEHRHRVCLQLERVLWLLTGGWSLAEGGGLRKTRKALDGHEFRVGFLGAGEPWKVWKVWKGIGSDLQGGGSAVRVVWSQGHGQRSWTRQGARRGRAWTPQALQESPQLQEGSWQRY